MALTACSKAQETTKQDVLKQAETTILKARETADAAAKAVQQAIDASAETARNAASEAAAALLPAERERRRPAEIVEDASQTE